MGGAEWKGTRGGEGETVVRHEREGGREGGREEGRTEVGSRKER